MDSAKNLAYLGPSVGAGMQFNSKIPGGNRSVFCLLCNRKIVILSSQQQSEDDYTKIFERLRLYSKYLKPT